jgi:hypothetical protein
LDDGLATLPGLRSAVRGSKTHLQRRRLPLVECLGRLYDEGRILIEGESDVGRKVDKGSVVVLLDLGWVSARRTLVSSALLARQEREGKNELGDPGPDDLLQILWRCRGD